MCIALLFFLLSLDCNCAFISPIAYTLTGVVSVNGSSIRAGCPQECEGVSSNGTIRTCDCRQTAAVGATITGILIDGLIPSIDLSVGEIWAASLYTVMTGHSTTGTVVGFDFLNSVLLHEVELYVFYCPSWDIGNTITTITVYSGQSFPNFNATGVDQKIGNAVLMTDDMVNCEDLTRITIPLEMIASATSYFIRFIPSQWLYIGEVRFYDQPLLLIETTTPTEHVSNYVITTPAIPSFQVSTRAIVTIVVVLVVLVLVIAGASAIFFVVVRTREFLISRSRVGVASDDAGDFEKSQEYLVEKKNSHLELLSMSSERDMEMLAT